MLSRKIGIFIAAAALTFSPVAVPSALAQEVPVAADQVNDNQWGVDFDETMPETEEGVIIDGLYSFPTRVTTEQINEDLLEKNPLVASQKKYKIYEYAGEQHLMELRQVRSNQAHIPTYAYIMRTKQGDRSDQCRIDMFVQAVNDPQLYSPSTNGFIYNIGNVDGATNEESKYVFSSFQHFRQNDGDNWRYNVAFAQDLYDVRIEIKLPKELDAEPTLAAGTLYTTGARGLQERTTLTGETMDVSDFLTVQPASVEGNEEMRKAEYTRILEKRPNAAEPKYPESRIYYTPDNWFEFQVEDTADPYTKVLYAPYVPEDSRFAIQWRLDVDDAEALQPTIGSARMSADKFCYDPSIVQQGTESHVSRPDNLNTNTNHTGTFERVDGESGTDSTPEWVEVDSSGRLTLRPGFDVEAGDYTIPIKVSYPLGGETIIQAPIKVIPAFFIAGYDDSYTGPGETTVVFPQSLRSVPENTKFELDSFPEGWTVTVDPDTGKLDIKTADDAKAGRETIKVKATYTAANGDVKEGILEAGVRVDRRVINFEIRDGELYVTYNDDKTEKIGTVVGPQGEQGPQGDSVRIKESAPDENGNTVITFITVRDGEDVEGSDQTITVSKGEKGDKGDPGRDGASVEIKDTYINDDGNTVIVVEETDIDGNVSEREVIVEKGQDGDSIRIKDTETDESGNTVIIIETVSVDEDGNAVVAEERVVVEKGDKGDKGDPGKDAEPLVIENSYTNDDGETVVEFSDGTTIVIPAPQSVTIVGTETDRETGDITIKFSTGEEITIPAGKDGRDGKDGTDGASLTIVSQGVDPETGLLTIVFSDGSEVALPSVPAPRIISQEVVEREPGKLVVELTYDNGDVVDIPVPADGTDGATITILEQRTQPDGSVEIVFSDGTTVTVEAPKAPHIVSSELNELGEMVIEWSNDQTVIIPQGPGGEQGLPGEDGKDGEDGTNSGSADNSASSDNKECLNAGLTVGIPLLALVPLGLLTTVEVPGTGPLFGQVNKQLADFNTQIQRQLGIFNQNAANSSAQFGGTAGQVGQIIGAVAGSALLITVGLLVANYLTEACSPAGEGFLPGSSESSN